MGAHLRRLLFALAALPVFGGTAYACPVCFQAVESPLLDAARLGVLAMITVVVAVLCAFGTWFIRLARLQRSHEHAGSGERG